MKAKRLAVTASPRVADQKYPTAAKRPPAPPSSHAASGAPIRETAGRVDAPAAIAAGEVDL